MSYNDPTLRTRLSEAAVQKVRKEHIGDKGYCNHFIGMTRVHIEQGLVYAEVTWGIDGLDMPVSSEIKELVESYVVTQKMSRRADGIYILRDKDCNVLARARVTEYYINNDKSEVYVSGEKRKDVIELFGLLRDGKVRPDIEHEEFEQVEGNLNELRRLRRQVPTLEHQVTSRDETIASLCEQLKNVRVELAEAQAAAAAN